MSDRIELRGLRFMAFCGVLPEEEARPQPLELDIDVSYDTTAAGRSDDLADAIDYGGLCAVVEKVVTAGRFRLLERLAQEVAEQVLATDGRAAAVTVSVRKLRPPVPQDLATAGVTVTRPRG